MDPVCDEQERLMRNILELRAQLALVEAERKNVKEAREALREYKQFALTT